MAVNREPVLKRCRSLGIDPTFMGLDKKSKRTIQRSNRKISEYALQLREKQRTKFIYGVLEKQFRNTFKKASKRKGITGENLLAMLECRLDNAVFRLGFASTRREARQMVTHGHFTVNGRKVDIPSYELKVDDVIKVKEKSAALPKFKEIKEFVIHTPEWLTADVQKLEGKINAIPTRDQIDTPISEHLIVELYSK